MSIKIVKKSGVTTTLASVPDSDRPLLADFDFKKSPVAIEAFCERLTQIPGTSIISQDEIHIAALLGFGTEEMRAKCWEGVFLADWPRICPWFLRPDIGDWLLPDDAVWEIHRVQVDGGHAGWATLSIPSSQKGPWVAEAKVPWAAWAICLLRAFKDDAYVPRRPKGD